MSRTTQELVKAHAQLAALRDAIKASAREVNRILARVERAMRASPATSTPKPRHRGTERER